MKQLILFSCLLLVTAEGLNAQEKAFPRLVGPYLGQEPPGMTPEAQVIWRGGTNHHAPDWSSAP
jgi:hypothetical protein